MSQLEKPLAFCAMHVAVVFGSVLLAVGNCTIPIGDAIEQAEVINESSQPVVVRVEDVGAKEVAAGAAGSIYSGAPASHHVKVLTTDCAVLATTTNSQLLLLMTIHADETVTFEQGANLTYVKHTGAITDTDACP